MSRKRIYLCHPNSRHNPMMGSWLHEIREVISSDSSWSDWSLLTREYNLSCSVSINEVAAMIKGAIGPCVLLRNVQERVIVEFRERLAGRAGVWVGSSESITDILNILQEARDQHLGGEPMLPRKLVVALLLVAKLERHNMWGGRNKGYMWASDLPKGRGLSEEFADQLPEVINDLHSNSLLIQKPSRSRRKYALNPDKRHEIHDIVRTRQFSEKLHRVLSRNARLTSARHLDILDQPRTI